MEHKFLFIHIKIIWCSNSLVIFVYDLYYDDDDDVLTSK